MLIYRNIFPALWSHYILIRKNRILWQGYVLSYLHSYYTMQEGINASSISYQSQLPKDRETRWENTVFWRLYYWIASIMKNTYHQKMHNITNTKYMAKSFHAIFFKYHISCFLKALSPPSLFHQPLTRLCEKHKLWIIHLKPLTRPSFDRLGYIPVSLYVIFHWLFHYS